MCIAARTSILLKVSHTSYAAHNSEADRLGTAVAPRRYLLA